MNSILVDYKNIIQNNNLHMLNKVIKRKFPADGNIGIIFIIPNNILSELKTVDIGVERLEYVNSEKFIENIKDIQYIIFDNTKRICELLNNDCEYIELVLDNLLSNIPNNFIIFVHTDIENNKMRQKYIENGFDHSFICKHSPLGQKFKKHKLGLYRKNNIMNESNNKNNIEYVLKQYEKVGCSITLQLTKSAVKFLKKCSVLGSSLNENNSITQKEIAGKFRVKNVTDDLVFVLEIDNESLITGDEQGVRYIGGLYNFHSHPKEAYEKNNVEFAWPSAPDYLCFLTAPNTIMHIVASLEGLYIISFGKYWADKKDMITDDTVEFVKKHYDFCYIDGNTVEWYIKTVNNILYEGHPLFNVELTDGKDKFNISYSNTDKNCFAHENVLSLYKNNYE